MKSRIGHICLCVAMVLAISSCKSKKGTEESVSDVVVSEEKFASTFFEGQKEKAIDNRAKAYEKFQTCAQLDPNEDAAFYELAKLDTLNGNFSLALEHISIASKLSPENLWYKRLKADVELASGDLNSAMSSLEDITTKAPNDIIYRHKLAELAAYNGDIATAINTYSQIENYSGVSEDITQKKYNLLIQDNKPDAAVLELERLSNAYPYDISYLRNIAVHYEKNGQADKVASIYEKIIDLNPNDGQTHLALAKFYMQTNQSAKIGNSLFIGFNDPAASVSSKLSIINTAIESPNATIDTEELIQILQETHPENGETWKLAGDIASGNGKEIEAIEHYIKALDYNPNDINLWLLVNSAAAQAKDYEQLKSVSDDALAYFPTEPKFYLYKGQSLIELGKANKAISTLTSGKDFTIGDDALKARFDLHIGRAHFQSEAYDLAQKWFEKALTSAGVNQGITEEYLGDAYFQQGNKAKALEFWNKAKSSGGASDLLEQKIANEKYISQ